MEGTPDRGHAQTHLTLLIVNGNYVMGMKTTNVILTPTAECMPTFQAPSSPLQPSAHAQVVMGKDRQLRNLWRGCIHICGHPIQGDQLHLGWNGDLLVGPRSTTQH